MENNVNSLIKGATLNEAGVIYVLTKKVSCDGGVLNSPHPKVFLKIPEGKYECKCPYCGQTFVYKASNEKS